MMSVTDTGEWPYGILLFVLLLTNRSIMRLTKGSKRANATGDGLYEDEDGAAAEHSAIQFSSKQSFIFIWVVVAAGLALSFSLAIFVTIQRDQAFGVLYLTRLWLLFAAWLSKQLNLSMK
ncbi:hypothetical protein L207DRAFT_18972 [Hyaloscypha variabilis F]|uniref:Uncharacterized protein n=1 Tax=Hyaloscypha variabilis (strain UAMH 11265 / GT02V1 / F) TaxID=1149755 RepID=A0A2J6SDS3_HYAVF|nr:hypothetical protein L207DRAFT_18972 [Hyaloscypha variabilis F]